MKTKKTILVPTDFSRVADNATDYAVEVALALKARIVLIHMYQVPVMTEEILMGIDELNNMEKTFMASLRQVKTRLHRKYGNKIQVDCICRSGFTVEATIQAYINENGADLIVMGMSDHQYPGEKLIGNKATALIRHSSCPVLVISRLIKFKNPDNIVLAYDYHRLPGKHTFSILKEFVEIFNSKVFILHIVKNNLKSLTLNQAINGNGSDKYFNAADLSFDFIENEDTIEGINDFVENKHADIIVVIPHKHHLLESILSPSNSKRLVFHTKVPVLALK